MPRAPALLLGAAAVLLTAGLTAFVIVAAVGFGLGTRWAREHVPGLRTFAMELAAQRDACLALRSRLRRQAREKVEPLESWGVWRARIDAWDAPFWQLLERRLPDLWRVYRRENSVILDDYGDRWPSEMLDLLEGRWQLITPVRARAREQLMPRLRSMTPGALLRWKARRPASIHHALDVARGNQRYDLPFRAVVRQVDVEIQPTARSAKITVPRLELECGHLVPLPGGALINRMRPGQLRQCEHAAEEAT